MSLANVRSSSPVNDGFFASIGKDGRDRELNSSRERAEIATQRLQKAQLALDMKNPTAGAATRPESLKIGDENKEAAKKQDSQQNEIVARKAAALEMKIKETLELLGRLEREKKEFFNNLAPDPDRISPVFTDQGNLQPVNIPVLNLTLPNQTRNIQASGETAKRRSSMLPNLESLKYVGDRINQTQNALHSLNTQRASLQLSL